MFANKVEHQKGYFVFFSYFLFLSLPVHHFLLPLILPPVSLISLFPHFPSPGPAISHSLRFCGSPIHAPPSPPPPPPPPLPNSSLLELPVFPHSLSVPLPVYPRPVFPHPCLHHYLFAPPTVYLNYRFCSSLSTLSSNVIDFITSWRRLAEVIKSIAFAVSVDSDSGFVCQHDKLKKLSNVLIRKFVGLKD